MPTPWRRFLLLVGATGLVLGGGGPAPVLAAGGETPASPAAAGPVAVDPLAATSAAVGATSSPAAAGKGHRVSYRGVSLDVPSDWQVVDLAADPSRCVRLDVNAVYLGDPGPQQDCPAHLVGRAETIHLRPASAQRLAATTARPTTVGRMAARTGANPVGRSKQVWFTSPNVEAEVFWGADEAAVEAVLATAAPTNAPTTGPATSSQATSGQATPATPARATPARTATDAPLGVSRSLAGEPRAQVATTLPSATASTASTGATTFTGMGFDTCAAPSVATMQSWFSSSPYRAAGIYIGGSMRACPDGNLSSSWVSQTTSMGWGLIPIYVGVQAPCVNQTGLATIDPSRAAAQGKASADDAVSRAQSFGLGAGTPIYYDMEGYRSSDQACVQTVLTFMSAWTAELHALGYLSGAYGSTSSLMVDMSNAVAAGTSGFVPPDDVWFAHWNGLQTLSDSASYPAFKDIFWSRGQRLHQYDNLTETWGGVSINIDANWLGGQVAGSPVPVDYGPNVFGPGGTSFVFTGSMSYWKPNPGQGLRGRAYSTYSNGATESNGATWSPQLPPGTYAVSAYIPATRASATVPYTIKDANGTVVRTVNQSTVTGYAALGSFVARSGSPITVHLGDNGPSPTTAQVGADAMSFQLVANVPSAPTSVSAVPGDKRATVRWRAPSDNGSPITAYTVTASPGGASVTVAGTATSAVVTGLTNGTAYTFTVTARNGVGTGPASAPSAPVTPLPHGHLVPVAPVRLLDTRVGTATNPVKVALAPWGSLTVTVAGVTGSPVPAGAQAAAINLTVTAPQTAGFLTADSTASGGTSTANFTAGRTVANLVITRLAANGTMTVVNHSGGSVQVVADVEGYVTATGTTSTWVSPAPVRLLDTRTGTATNPVKTALAPGASLTVKVAGVSGSPVPSGATAAAVNLTATSPTAAGYLTADSTASGGTSTANFTAGQTVANLVITRLATNGTMTIVNHSRGTVHVVADVGGYLGPTGSTNQWVSPTPVRLLDTRTGTATNPVKTALAPRASLTVKVAGVAGSPVPAGATSASINLTATSPTAAGFLTADSAASGGTSTANFSAGQTVANLVISRLASNGTMTIVNRSSGTVQVIADVEGYLH
ncbi:glycoside hydrolase domain-containing protein [Humibacillus xanthopallidus]|nr:glycoside hydrolase domain-containing protein [Humibacillus xanthopallidus]